MKMKTKKIKKKKMKNIREIINNPYLGKLEIYFNTKYDIIMKYLNFHIFYF